MNALCKKYNSTVVFSSATQPAFSYRKDLDWQPVEIINDNATLFQHTKRVHVNWRMDGKTGFSDLAKEISQSNCCCAIVNIKKHSVEIYKELKSICKSDSDSLFHISTDMCIAHREAVLKEINYRIENKMPCRLVSTQCIEAGVDLDFDKVYRALAPLDAIIQSAGRCNRNGRLLQGEVVVFIPEDERYPDAAYENAANIVKLLSKDADIDIYNANHIREYYRKFYQTFSQDKGDLTKAIDTLNFEGVTNAYQLIPNKGFTVIVPYTKSLELFKEICETARTEGLSPLLMKKARTITVNIYNKKIKDVGEQLYFKPTKAKQEKALSNWFILLDHNLYNEKTGLQLENSESLNTII
jgi:CRISPR/Cas system-associated endonuclease/helicase Cas3